MSPKEKLALRDKGILERKFIRDVLSAEGKNLLQAHTNAISSYLNTTGRLGSALKMSVQDKGISGGVLSISHTKRQRFIDMKTRKGIRKKSFPIHNKVLYNRLPGIVSQLKFGFTQAVKDKIIRNHTIEING